MGLGGDVRQLHGLRGGLAFFGHEVRSFGGSGRTEEYRQSACPGASGPPALLVLLPWLVGQWVSFTGSLFESIPGLVTGL